MPTSDPANLPKRLKLVKSGSMSDADCLDKMIGHATALLDLCDQLERIADMLPVMADTRECLCLAEELIQTVQAAHHFEESCFFNVAREMIGQSDTLNGVIERLCEEHLEDQCFAEEVRDTMIVLSKGPAVREAETAGYLLRGFFGQLRRHVAFEHDYLCVPVARLLGRSPDFSENG
ncbi:MAG: hemerythrin domain-containing protein [Alphaproteobacteria bacterium]